MLVRPKNRAHPSSPPVPHHPDPLVLRGYDGALLRLEPWRWHGPATGQERELLAGLLGPVLDVGCGPGRMVEALAHQGVVALGVDPAPGAALLARRRGCPVLQRSVFEPLPGEGRWGSVLLLDGNLGIGGDPLSLLRRCRGLVRSGGCLVAEVEPPGTQGRTCRARLERGCQSSAWFAWSVVSADSIDGLAARAGFGMRTLAGGRDGRWFAHLTPRHA